jgi:hypothetical protein
MDFNTFKKFYLEYYCYLNPDLCWNNINSPIEIFKHFQKNLNAENRKYKFSDIFPNFNWMKYREANPTFNNLLNTKEDYEYHYFKIGFIDELPLNIIQKPLEKPLLLIKDKEELEKQEESLEKEENSKPIIKQTSVRIAFFLVGFGDPFIEIKLEILKSNLNKIKIINQQYIVDLYIFVYTIEKRDILDSIQFQDYVSNVYIYTERGIVGEFIYKYVSQKYILYDYIVLFLDDIELGDKFDINKLIYIYTKEQLDILGLPLTLDSPTNHEFMLCKKDNRYNYRQTNFIELFFYLMSKQNFKKYIKLFDKYTRWCWGIDLCLYNLQFKLGIYDEYPIKHYFKAKSYNRNLPNALLEFEKVRRKNIMIEHKLNLIRKIL